MLNSEICKPSNIKSCDFTFLGFSFLHFRKSSNPRSMCHRSAAQTSGTAVPKLPDNRCGIQVIPPLAELVPLRLTCQRPVGSGAPPLLPCFALFCHSGAQGESLPLRSKNQLPQIFLNYPGLNLKTSFSIERGLLRPLRISQQAAISYPSQHQNLRVIVAALEADLILSWGNII